jgi:diguanylate cyclase (GGDEF)-like protein
VFQTPLNGNVPHSMKFITKSNKSKKSANTLHRDTSVMRKIENLLRIIEREEGRYMKLKTMYHNYRARTQLEKEKIKSVIHENRVFKKRIGFLQEQINTLNDMLEGIHKNYQISAEASVNLLSELEYNKYKSRFIDIDIDYPPSIEKLDEYGKNIKSFFLNDMHCTYLYIHCNGITEDLKNLLHVNTRKTQKDSASFIFDRSNFYNFNLEDIDLPERKLGRITIGRYPYKSQEKEKDFNKRIEREILITKRLLEKCILEIQNKELAIKDALTGLHSRKFLIERLTEEFNSMDLFSKLGTAETNLLKIIMKSEGVAAPIVKNQYFAKNKTRDEVLYDKTLARLKTLSVITTDTVKHAGEWVDCYYFENSKMSYELYLAMLDLDHFKDVNDNWGGHTVGDRILRDFADILKRNIRTTDIPVRYGGEEFIIIFPRSMNYPRIYTVLENIRLECENKLLVEWGGKKRNITVSIGVTQINKFDVNVQFIINRADAALYKAKKKRNRIVMCMQDHDGELIYS